MSLNENEMFHFTLHHPALN